MSSTMHPSLHTPKRLAPTPGLLASSATPAGMWLVTIRSPRSGLITLSSNLSTVQHEQRSVVDDLARLSEPLNSQRSWDLRTNPTGAGTLLRAFASRWRPRSTACSLLARSSASTCGSGVLCIRGQMTHHEDFKEESDE